MLLKQNDVVSFMIMRRDKGMACRYIADPLQVSATDIDVQESLVTEGGLRIGRRQRKAYIGATKGAAQLDPWWLCQHM